MKRKVRLRQNSDFQRVRQFGQSYASPMMVLAFLRNELDYNRFGFVVNKRLGKAVERNKIKRQLREAVRLRLSEIKPGHDLVLIARKSTGQVSFTAICQSLDRLLKSADLLL
jgi:ribonuclease P protein component